MYFEIEIDLQQKYPKVSKSIKKYQKVSSNVVQLKTFKQILIVSTL